VPEATAEQAPLIERDVAAIVHDLKSPLSAIALEATLLHEKLARNDRVTAGRSVERITRNVAFLDRLVLDLLDACSLETGHFRLRKERIELGQFLTEMIERLVRETDRERIYIDIPHPIEVTMDPHRIERVVANLLDNAIKYAKRSAPIVVRATSCMGRVCISVIDEGPGISDAELPFVFERHRRAESSAGRFGNGLGLYVSKRIVEAHGGQIAVESIANVGSRFSFELPAN